MKRVIVSISVLCLLTPYNVVPTLAQGERDIAGLLSQQTNEKVWYKLKLEKGQKYHYQMTSDGKFFDGGMRQQRPTMLQTIGTGAEISVDDIDSDGNAWATYTYTWLSVNITSASRRIAYDSSKKGMQASQAEQGYAAVVGESFSIKITPEGRIAEIKGLDNVRRNVRMKIPAGSMQASTMETLNEYLQDDDVKHEIEKSLAIYPEEPVGIGDSWSRRFVSSGQFAKILTNTWTLKERRNGVAVIEVVSSIKPNPQAKPSKVGSEKVRFNFSGKQQGFVEIQESTGLIIRSEVNQEMSGRISTARPGVPVKVTAMKIVGVIGVSMKESEKAAPIVEANVLTSRDAGDARENAFESVGEAKTQVVQGKRLTGQELADAGRALFQAVVNGDIDRVKSQISAGADLKSKNRMGWTMLHTAIRNRRTEIAQLLIDKGADVNVRDNHGRRPLHLAVESGQKAIVEKLITKGADINAIDGRADNALTLARKKNQKEITELLIKNGAEEPDLEALRGDRLYSSMGRPQGAGPNQNSGRLRQPGTMNRNVSQSPVAVDLLADPNEIKTRVKTFDGLEKSVKEVSDKSKNELRQWQQTRHDNRTILMRTVDKQFEDELDFIHNVAVEESAKKTAEAINNLRTNRRKRFLKVNRRLVLQKREMKQAESASIRGRGRTTGRSTRGRTSMRGQTSGTNTTDPLYGSGTATMQRGYGPGSAGRPAEQIDPQTQEKMRLWLQTTPDNKLELARAIHPQIQAEISFIRTIAVEEKAKKTTAAIDGLLLARKERFDGLVIKMEEVKRKLQEAQGLNNRTNDPGQAYQQGGRYGGRTSRRGTQTDTQQRGTRTRRR